MKTQFLFITFAVIQFCNSATFAQCTFDAVVTTSDVSIPGCANGGITITPSGPGSPWLCSILNAGGTTIASNYLYTGNSWTYNQLAAGTYSVTVASGGCTETFPNLVINSGACNTIVSVSSTNVTAFGCANGSVTINASSAGSAWTLCTIYKNGAILTYAYVYPGTPYVLGSQGVGTYYAVGVNTCSQCSATSGTTEITTPDCNTTVSLTATDVVSAGCNNGSITINASSAGSAYTICTIYKNNAVLTYAYVYPNTPYVLGGQGVGTYYVVGVNPCSACSATSNTVEIFSPVCNTTVSVSSANPTTPGCNNGSLTINASAPNSAYVMCTVYKNDVVYASAYVYPNTPYVLGGLNAGTYYATGANTCSACSVTSNSTVITDPVCSSTLTVSKTDVTMGGCTNGIFTINASSQNSAFCLVTLYKNGAYQTAGYAYPNTPYNFGGLGAGSYYVTSVNQCNACLLTSETLVISEPVCNLSISSVTSTNAKNSSCDTGTISVDASQAGSANIAIQLFKNGVYQLTGYDLPTSTFMFGGLAPGNYELKCTNTCGGCLVSQFIEVGNDNFCPADMDCNNTINTGDLLLFTSVFGCAGNCVEGDFDMNNAVNVGDLLLFSSLFGSSCAAQ